MFNIELNTDGEIRIQGRFDAAQVSRAEAVLKKVTDSCVIDFADLDYISSAGIGVLLAMYQRLDRGGMKIKLINMNKHIRDIFRYAGLDKVFVIE